MAEDQGKNGDRWTDEASRLFLKSGWEKIGDSNIDIEGADGLKHGIDSIFTYRDGFNPKIDQGVFLEAKSYKTTSFSQKKISDWVERLDAKIRDLRFSLPFQEKYPAALDSDMRNGVLAIWFHDHHEYLNFTAEFQKALLAVKVPKSGGPQSTKLRLFVLENHRILKICSLLATIDTINTELAEELKQVKDDRVKFYYPSSAGFGHSTQALSCLNLEYIFSKFVLAKASFVKNDQPYERDYVFYFGELNIQSFHVLRDAMSDHNMINGRNDLVIYRYKAEDSEFRKIEPDVSKLFTDREVKNIEIKRMTVFGDLPSFLTNK